MSLPLIQSAIDKEKGSYNRNEIKMAAGTGFLLCTLVNSSKRSDGVSHELDTPQNIYFIFKNVSGRSKARISAV